MQDYMRVLVSLVCTLHACTVLSRAEQRGHDIRRGDGRVGWRTIGGDVVWHGREAVGVHGSLLLLGTAAHAMFQAGHAAAVFMATMAWQHTRWATNGWMISRWSSMVYSYTTLALLSILPFILPPDEAAHHHRYRCGVYGL